MVSVICQSLNISLFKQLFVSLMLMSNYKSLYLQFGSDQCIIHQSTQCYMLAHLLNMISVLFPYGKY